MELRDMTKLRSLPADKQDVGSPTLDPAFSCDGISELLRPTARAYPGTKILAEFTYTKPRTALIVGQRAPAKRWELATMARRTSITRAPCAFAVVPANATNASRRSIMIVRVPKPAELGERPKRRLALDIPFTIATVGCRSLKQARNCMFHELSAGMTSAFTAFSTVADEQSTPPHWRWFLGSHPKDLRPTDKPETAMGSRWNRTRDGSNWGNVLPFGNRLRQRQHYCRLRCAPLCVSCTVGSPDTAVAAVG